MRYSLQYGKWGAYFRDDEQGIDLPLEEVLKLLNYLANRVERTRGEPLICAVQHRADPHRWLHLTLEGQPIWTSNPHDINWCWGGLTAKDGNARQTAEELATKYGGHAVSFYPEEDVLP